MYMCVVYVLCKCVCVCVYSCTYLWRSGVDVTWLSLPFTILFFLFFIYLCFETCSLTKPGAHELSELSGHQSHKNSAVPLSHGIIGSYGYSRFLLDPGNWKPGPHFQSKHFTPPLPYSPAISPAHFFSFGVLSSSMRAIRPLHRLLFSRPRGCRGHA